MSWTVDDIKPRIPPPLTTSQSLWKGAQDFTNKWFSDPIGEALIYVITGLFVSIFFTGSCLSFYATATGVFLGALSVKIINYYDSDVSDNLQDTAASLYPTKHHIPIAIVATTFALSFFLPMVANAGALINGLFLGLSPEQQKELPV